jgi:AcrR family transcriptional regulator
VPNPGSIQPRGSKRRRTASEILENGVTLFREQGVRRTRTDQIARASAVSAATFFNHFPSKAALAEAWLRGEVDRRIEEAGPAIRERGLRTALRGACRSLAAGAADAPALRFEAWRTVGRARERGPGLSHPLVVGIEQDQAAERIRRDVSAALLVELILDALESGLIDGLRDAQAPDDLARSLQLRVDLILDGARKRNERVVAPRGTLAAGATADPHAEDTHAGDA